MFTFKISSVFRAAVYAFVGVAAAACISNDLPYPWVQPVYDSITVQATDSEGHDLLAAPVSIDSVSRTVTIYLTEYADIRSVRIESWTLSNGSECLDAAVMEAPLDLSSPVSVTLQLYGREYEWTIRAEQTIDRYFTIASQIGSSQIDVQSHKVNALVPTQQSLDDIEVRSLKLGGPMSVVTPALVGKKVDFTSPVKVMVEEFGSTTEWTLTVEQTDVSVSLDRVDAWTQVAWLYASAEVGKTNGFEYRKASDEDWTVVPEEWVTHSGGSFSACLRNLEPQTAYVTRAISGDENSAEISFTTEAIVQLPNSEFRDWWLNDKVWNPWTESGESFWDTGNKGAATLGKSNTLPIEDPMSPTGYHGAKLETKFVGISIMGKLGAGNLFAGSYVRTDGTNGVLAFGRPFVNRPTKVKVRMKYTTAPITDASKSNPDLQYMIGEPDTCIVWCALGDWDQPFEIRTKPTDRHLFDVNDPGVIAYGQFQSGSSIDEYMDVVFDIDYKSTNRVPAYLLLTASASKYGDYFTGGRGATLYILGYELLYDY